MYIFRVTVTQNIDNIGKYASLHVHWICTMQCILWTHLDPFPRIFHSRCGQSVHLLVGLHHGPQQLHEVGVQGGGDHHHLMVLPAGQHCTFLFTPVLFFTVLYYINLT